MSAKGSTDMLCMPDKFSNHYLKDDCLYISYGVKIHEAEPLQNGSLYEKTLDLTKGSGVAKALAFLKAQGYTPIMIQQDLFSSSMK